MLGLVGVVWGVSEGIGVRFRVRLAALRWIRTAVVVLDLVDLCCGWLRLFGVCLRRLLLCFG